jgi:hypothetical protein
MATAKSCQLRHRTDNTAIHSISTQVQLHPQMPGTRPHYIPGWFCRRCLSAAEPMLGMRNSWKYQPSKANDQHMCATYEYSNHGRQQSVEPTVLPTALRSTAAMRHHIVPSHKGTCPASISFPQSQKKPKRCHVLAQLRRILAHRLACATLFTQAYGGRWLLTL